MKNRLDWGSLPLGANPERDIPWGQDDLGNTQYRMANGTTYVVKPRSPLSRQGAPGSADRIKSVLGGMIRGMGDAMTAPGRAAAGQPVTNGDVTNLAGMVQLGGAAMPAPKGALRSGALRDSDTYIRRSRLPDTPDNGAGYAMFVKGSPDLDDAVSSYGPYGWSTTADGAVDVADIQKDIVRSIRARGLQTDYQTTAAQLAREAAPADIVNSAGMWDAPDLVQAVWDDVLDPRGITKVRTRDGLLLFDPASSTRYLANGSPGVGLFSTMNDDDNKKRVENYLMGLK